MQAFQGIYRWHNDSLTPGVLTRKNERHYDEQHRPPQQLKMGTAENEQNEIKEEGIRRGKKGMNSSLFLLAGLH